MGVGSAEYNRAAAEFAADMVHGGLQFFLPFLFGSGSSGEQIDLLVSFLILYQMDSGYR